MQIKLNRLLWLALFSFTASAFGQQSASAGQTSQVVITGHQTDTEARRDFVAGKIIIGRKRIEESSAENVSEVLNREPAISVSADGRIGLLGLPGYTQILVDGQPPQAGKGLEQLNLVHVEKIEIIKSSIAEYGPFGIAGTINVITRKTVRKSSTQLSVGMNGIGHDPGASFSFSHNQSEAGSPLRLSARVNAGTSRSNDDRTTW